MDITHITEVALTLILGYAPKLLLSVVTFFIGFRIVKMVVKMTEKALALQHVDQSLAGFLQSLISIGLKGLVIITVANMVGIQMTSFIALLGAAGLAVGLSLQGSLANLAGGVLILLFKPYKVGDLIETGGHKGRVKSIEIFSTILKTLDNKTIIIPNGELSNGSIVNYSTEKTRRVDMVFGIGYGDSIQKAREVIQGVIDKDERILKDPASLIVVGNLGASSVDLTVRVWVNVPDYWPVFFAMQENVKNAFDDAGVSIPFPQRDVHLIAEQSDS